MSLDALTNRSEYLSAHYLAEILPGSLKSGVLKQWADEERHDRETPRTRLRALRRSYNKRKSELAELTPGSTKYTQTLRALHREILTALGFPEPTEATEPAETTRLTVERAGQEHVIPVVHAEPGIVVIESGWATDADAATDPDDAGRLLDPITVDPTKPMATAAALASYLLLGNDQPPRYVVILSGAVVILADRLAWFEGRYLAVSLDVAYGRNDTTAGGELDVIAALFGAESLRPPPEGGAELLAALREGSRQHAVGVSADLREGLRLSVEVIANEVLRRIREAGVTPEQIMDPVDLGKELARESLRYLYRILFLLYAEARPELGVLPVTDDDYIQGYSLARLGEVATRKLIGESAERGFHLYESLDLLFGMVNEGHHERGAVAVDEQASEGAGLRFEPLKSDLFLPEKTRLIGRDAIVHPDFDEDDPDAPHIDTRLRNACLHQVLRWLMISRGKKKGRGGFISYAQLGINQLGAVYEGLMSYTGFIATEELYEVAKKGDPKDGSWMIPASKESEYPREVFVERTDEETGVRSRVHYDRGSFVYRLAGRDRQTSASYYTPQSLTEVTVQLALKYRLEEEGREVTAREMLDWTICEPALGSGAFLNEAINQVAAEYLRRAQKERGETLDPERYAIELQKVKAYIALHNCYGVDLNRTAVELAEVSLWLNTMHPGLQAPWFGLHLRRGNSLIGCGRKTYTPKQLTDKSWLKTAPEEHKLRDGDLPPGVIHHFLLPAEGWGAVAGNTEAKSIAPEDAKRLGTWRRGMHKTPVAKGKRNQVQRLLALSGRVEYLWKLVQRRLEISEKEIRRDIAVWGAEDLPPVPAEAVLRDKILKDLESPGTPYWRLKTVMDAWCALWFWPLDKAALLDGTAPEYGSDAVTMTRLVEEPVYELARGEQGTLDIDLGIDQQLTLPTPTKQVGTRTRKQKVPLRKLVPLANLDDWIEFAEAMLGRHDIPPDSLIKGLEKLPQIEAFEDSLTGLMGMDGEARLADRFPWLTVAMNLAEEQGFFHWELTFAQAFANGGFDLQVGNPPWVRPTWQEDIVLAERDPWFVLAENVPTRVWRDRKSAVANGDAFFAREITTNTAYVTYYSAPTTYPMLAGTQPDLYRAFACQVWRNLSATGMSGLIHPDSHFNGPREGRLRALAYQHLRLHAHFQNMRLLFKEINWRQEFGIHVYGAPRAISFVHASWLYATETLAGSVEHDGRGDLPGMKAEGTWDLRPHRGRLVPANEAVLTEWRSVVGELGIPVDQTRLLQPVTTGEQAAIVAIADIRHRLLDRHPMISSGFHEKGAKDDGIIAWHGLAPNDWCDVVLQGPHFSVASPLSKQPNIPCRSNKDYEPWNLGAISDEAVPRTNYRRLVEIDKYRQLQDVWDGRPYTEYYRLAWREMVPLTTERSLFAAIIPPGPTHIHAIRSMHVGGNRETVLHAAFWASLPLDYLLRITGRGHLDVNAAVTMPAPDLEHPLADAAILRVLRLNCLTNAYAQLWQELHTSQWSECETWAVDWDSLPEARALGDVDNEWSNHIPLRSERARRSALVELDALVAVWLGITEKNLLSMYRARFAVLNEYEAAMWFDASGRRITRDYYARGVNQTNDAYAQLMAYLNESGPLPEGYRPPFYKADRENEYRQAHAVFSKRLQDAIDAGWQPS
ncbi:MAG: class I SAM-dependent DNA methyltransferase [Dactylosporangium sp.]|nr:class I SAM-dependent DNA methyltransferase [Dactylosporangium sp.]NNJ59601.1 class I SAM-dependent DNA methyltransferase [Dactylosporangium sp.]